MYWKVRASETGVNNAKAIKQDIETHEKGTCYGNQRECTVVINDDESSNSQIQRKSDANSNQEESTIHMYIYIYRHTSQRKISGRTTRPMTLMS